MIGWSFVPPAGYPGIFCKAIWTASYPCPQVIRARELSGGGLPICHDRFYTASFPLTDSSYMFYITSLALPVSLFSAPLKNYRYMFPTGNFTLPLTHSVSPTASFLLQVCIQQSRSTSLLVAVPCYKFSSIYVHILAPDYQLPHPVSS